MEEYRFQVWRDHQFTGNVITVEAEDYEEASTAVDEIVLRDFPGCVAQDE